MLLVSVNNLLDAAISADTLLFALIGYHAGIRSAVLRLALPAYLAITAYIERHNLGGIFLVQGWPTSFEMLALGLFHKTYVLKKTLKEINAPLHAIHINSKLDHLMGALIGTVSGATTGYLIVRFLAAHFSPLLRDPVSHSIWMQGLESLISRLHGLWPEAHQVPW